MDVEAVLVKMDEAIAENRGGEVEGILTEAIHTAVEEGDDGALLQLLNELLGYYREVGRTEDSYQIADTILGVAEHMGLNGSLPYATCLLNIANAYRAGGRLVESLEYYKEVENIYAAVLPEKSLLAASLLNNKALLYQEMGSLNDAIEALNKALSIVTEAGEKFEIAVTHANLANTYIGLTDYDNALKEAKASVDCFIAMNLKDSHYASALYALGLCMFEAGDRKGAKDKLSEALTIMEESLGRNEFYYRIMDELKRCETSLYEENASETASLTKEPGTDDIKGLKIAKDLYEKVFKVKIEEELPEWKDKIAVGLLGRGSDCFGYDDEISRDHDWGPRLCVILSKETYDQIGQKLEEIYANLPKSFEGADFAPQVSGHKRHGIFILEDFVGDLLGTWPINDNDRFSIPDYAFASMINGEIFVDPEGQISRIREELSKGHPLNVLLRKIAQSAAQFCQRAQYNYKRALSRGDSLTAEIMLYEGIKDALKLAHYIDNVYPPHDKWLVRSVEDLSFGKELVGLCRAKDVDSIGKLLANKLYERSYISDIDDYLDHHTDELIFKSGIADKSIDELADMVTKLEFEAFDKVQNEGGRASCQDDYHTFSIMRKSQYLTWDKDMLMQYLYDFDREFKLGHNLITEKYGRMMESTAPERYAEIKDSFPFVNDEKKAIIEAIIAMQVKRREDFARKYPKLSNRARLIHTYEDTPYETSFETYLRGEMMTYSDKMLELYARYVIAHENNDESITEETMLNSVKLYGYDSLDEAENKA